MKKIIFIIALFFSGSLGARECNISIPFSTPTVDFIKNDDGTVLHKKTGLIWMRCSLGMIYENNGCQGDAGMYSWDEALRAASTYDLAEQVGWRVPNIKELASILEDACYSPAINQDVFPNPIYWAYWSSTAAGEFYGGMGWVALFSGDDYQGWAPTRLAVVLKLPVRLVRSIK